MALTNLSILPDEDYVVIDPQTGTVLSVAVMLVKVQDILDSGHDLDEVLEVGQVAGEMVDRFGKPLYADQ